MNDIKQLTVSDRLKDGTRIIIRAIRPDDKDKIIEAFNNLEPESVYTRFFCYKSHLTDDDLKWTTEVDFERDIQLVVTINKNGREIIIAGSRLSMLSTAPDAPKQAEVAFTVEEDFHGQGIASRLLQQLIKIAKEKKVSYLEAEVLSRNKAMMAVFNKSGLPVKVQIDGRTRIVTMALNEKG